MLLPKDSWLSRGMGDKSEDVYEEGDGEDDAGDGDGTQAGEILLVQLRAGGRPSPLALQPHPLQHSRNRESQKLKIVCIQTFNFQRSALSFHRSVLLHNFIFRLNLNAISHANTRMTSQSAPTFN